MKGEVQWVQVAFISSGRKETFPDLLWPGDFVPLCEEGAFVLLDTNVHGSKPGLSFLMDTSAKVIASFDFGEIYDFGSSADGKVFWIQIRDAVDRVPITIVRAYDYQGVEIFNKTYKAAADETITYGNQRYQIEIEKPDLPG